MKKWTEAELCELSELFHIANVALAGSQPSRYQRRVWASAQYHKAHPEVGSTAAYKALCREEAWRW